ncbi:MAG: hypothetical protein QXJ06_04205 [Candidatus Aenigmatarchaeota archaeon]|nr:hypothetical protein [Candidatus Aenigmarchaeota archaeon]
MIDFQDEFQKLGMLIYAGLVYGSMKRDIDIFIVLEDYRRFHDIKNEIDRISRSLGKPMDVDIKDLGTFDYRIMNHDYYIASVLATTQFYISNQSFFEIAKRRIFADITDRKPILFNFMEGLSILDFCEYAFQSFEFYRRFEWYKTNPNPNEFSRVTLDGLSAPFNVEQSSESTRYYLGETVRNIRFSLGYLIAVKKMVENGRVIDLYTLLSNPLDTPEYMLFMECTIDIERYKEGNILDPTRIRNNIKRLKEFYRICAKELKLL